MKHARKWNMQTRRQHIAAADTAPRAMSLAGEVRFDAPQVQADGQAGGPPTFSLVAYTGRAIRQAWSKNPLVVDLAGMDMARQSIPILFGHDHSLEAVLGQSTAVVSDGEQLTLTGELIGETQTAQQVLALARKGMQFQASIGADTSRIENIAQGEPVTVNGRDFTGPISVVRASALREVSIVLMGADAQTSAAIAAEATEGYHMADAIETPTEAEAKVEATAIVAGETKQEPKAPAIDVAALKAELRAELLGHMRAERAAPAIHVAEPVDSARVVEAALCLQAGLGSPEKAFDERTLEAASKARNSVSLSEVFVKAAVANGYTGAYSINKANVAQVLQASFATHDISNILSNVVNKFLLQGFMSVEKAWESIAAVRSVSDFKALNLLRLNGSFKFLKTGNAGEIKVAAASDTKRSVSADTYAISTQITRQDLVNDDSSALSMVPARMGRGAALALNELVFGTFEDSNAAYYSGATAGSGNALTIGSLTSATTGYLKLKDPDGNPLGIAPRVLLVPADLAIPAAQLMSSQLLISGNTTATPATNVLAGRYKVVPSAYLSSSSTWWLCADPQDLPTLDVVFLNGQQVPTIEQVQADYQLLGVALRGFLDVGVCKGEGLAAYRMATA
jgi:hypothetical protein